MSTVWKCKLQRLFLACNTLLLMTAILGACGGSGNGVATSTSHSTPPAALVFQAYTGSGFSISYPATWVIRTAKISVTFSDLSGAYNLLVSFTPDPRGAVTSDQLAETSRAATRASLRNPQNVQVSSTINLAGVTWSQRAVSGTTLSNGQQIAIEVMILATTYPPHASNTRGVVLTYLGAKSLFQQAQRTYFAPMLQAFKFTG